MFTNRSFARAAKAAAASAVVAVGALALTPAVASAQTEQCVAGSLDYCYSKQEMREFLEVSVDLVEGYFQELAAQGQPYPEPSAVVYIESGETTRSQCNDGNGGQLRPDDTAYAYCPVDNKIFIGQETLWLFYSEFGAAAPIVGLAHEYGHALQDAAGVPEPYNSNLTIRHEDQADCIAGSWTKYIDDQGLLERRMDLTNVGELLYAIGEMEGPDQTHGTPGERVGSFLLGFAGGLEACNAFNPDSSITD